MSSTAVSILLKATDTASAIFQRAVGTIGGSVQQIANQATAKLNPAFAQVRAQVARNVAAFAADFPRTAAIAGAAHAKIAAGSAAMATKMDHSVRVIGGAAGMMAADLGRGLGMASRAMGRAASEIASGASMVGSAAMRGFHAAGAGAAATMRKIVSLTASGFAAAGRAAVSGMNRLRSAAVSGFKAAGSAAAGFGKKLASLMSGPLAQLAGAFAIGAAIKKSIDAFAGAEERAHRLGIALRVNGEDAASTVPKLQAYAKEIASVTTLSVGASMKLMEMGARLRIPSGALKDATKAAIGLSTALGIDQEEALQKVNQALNGNFKSLQKYIPQLRNAKTDAEKLAIVQKFAAGGFEMAKGKTDTLAGSLERFGNLTHSVFKKIGSIIGPVVKDFVSKFAEKLPAIEAMLDNVAAWFGNLRATLQPIFAAVMEHAQRMWAVFGVVFDGIKGMLVAFDGKFSESGGVVQSVASVITSVSNFMAKGIITAFTVIETAIMEWSRIWKLAVTTVQLAIVIWVEDIKHLFGTVIPTYLAWFGRNWKQVFVDTFNGTITIITNFAKMMGNMIKRIWDFIASGMKGGVGGLLAGLAQDANHSLLEGFKATAEALPQIMARKITAEQRRLEDLAGTLGVGIGGTFMDSLNKRLGGLAGAMATASKATLSNAKKDMEALNLDQLGGGKDKAKKKAHEKTDNKAVESRFLTRSTGASHATAKSALAEHKKTNATLKELHTETKNSRIANEKTYKRLGQFATTNLGG